MKKVWLSLMGLLFSIYSYAALDEQVVGGCISPNGTTITLQVQHLGPHLYIYINGVNVTVTYLPQMASPW